MTLDPGPIPEEYPAEREGDVPTREQGQLGMDEVVVDSAEAEAALEERFKRKASLTAVRALFEEADEAAKGIVIPLLPDGAEAVRIGRFRITKTVSKERSVSFTTPGGKVTVRIAEDGSDE